MKSDNEILLLCECSSAEHQIIIRWNNNDKEVYFTIFLANCEGFWKRVWYAIKYIFGYKSRYGNFDEIILRKEDAKSLQKVVDFLNTQFSEEEINELIIRMKNLNYEFIVKNDWGIHFKRIKRAGDIDIKEDVHLKDWKEVSDFIKLREEPICD